METTKKIAFIDIEANQLNLTPTTTEHFILEYSVFPLEKNGWLSVAECYSPYPLSARLCQLLKKEKNHYRKFKTPEKQAYEDLVKLSKEYELVCYGSYDQIILDSAAKRYNLEKIKLFDYSEVVDDIFRLPESASVSLAQLKKLFKISFANEKEHSSFWDAKVLREVYRRIESIKNVERLKSYLSLERLRPKQFETSRYTKNRFVLVPANFRILYCENKMINVYGDELKEDGSKKVIRVDLFMSIKSFDQAFNLQREDTIIIEDYNGAEGRKKFSDFKKDIISKYKNFYQNLFIFDGKLWSKFFKIDNKTYYAPHRISLKLFQSIKLTPQQKIKVVKKYYEKGKFDKSIDYEQTIKNLNIFK